MRAAYAEIDLNALHHNLMRVRNYAPSAKVMAVIKANAYGHGLVRVSEAIKHKVDALAVARVDEGIRLRESGFQKPITILEGFVDEDDLDRFYQYQLDSVVHSLAQVDIMENSKNRKVLSIWLKMDTGMNRLGLKGNDFFLAWERLKRCKHVQQPPGLMTHLANSDDINDDKTPGQIKIFRTATHDMDGPCSIANSAAILAWENAQAEWVRPGIMLFGCSPFSGKRANDFDLKPVMSLHSHLISIKTVQAGETVGYGGTWICQSETRLGVVAIGYGDGYPRHVRHATPVLINGERVPLVGRVSMDMITVDLTSQPAAKPGDPVTLWGPGLAVEEIAAAADTIPYTLLCGITQRVQVVER